VPALLVERGAPAGAAAAVTAYVKGLQDWQAGGHEWHARSSRYMNDGAADAGIGTAVSRLGMSPAAGGGRQRVRQHTPKLFAPVGHLPLPELRMPYPVRTNPHLDAARAYSVGWARDMGFFDSVPGVEAGGVWDERRFGVFDLAHCAAMIHPDAEPERLYLSTDWLSWGTYGDDYFPVVFGSRRDVAAAKACDARLSLYMPLDDGVAVPAPANPIERGLADLWRRTAGPMEPAARREFRTAVMDMTASWVWEVANQAQNRVPDPVDYVEMRRKTFGSDMTKSLARLANYGVVPEEIYRNRVVHELDTAAQDYACLVNDLFSYQKEVRYEGEVHNLVVVVETVMGVDRMRACRTRGCGSSSSSPRTTCRRCAPSTG
jgi:germacradienol/geosmin synthase